MEDDVVLLGNQLGVGLELVLEEQVGDFGSLADESLNHRVFFIHSKLFGDPQQFFVEFRVDGQVGFFEQLSQAFTHVFHEYFLQLDSPFFLFLFLTLHVLHFFRRVGVLLAFVAFFAEVQRYLTIFADK